MANHAGTGPDDRPGSPSPSLTALPHQDQNTTGPTNHSSIMSSSSADRNASQASPSVTGLENLNVRDRRRNAIYGVQGLVDATSASPQDIGLVAGPGPGPSQVNSTPSAATSSNAGPMNSFASSAAPPQSHAGILNEPPSISEASRARTISLPETGDIHDIRNSRASDQDSRRRRSSTLGPNEDLNTPQAGRPWHEHAWPSYDGHTKSRNTDGGSDNRGHEVGESSGNGNGGLHVARGDNGVTNPPQPEPSSLADGPAVTNTVQSEEPDSEFLPYVRAERPTSPYRLSERNLATIDPNTLQKLGITYSGNGFVRPSHTSCIVHTEPSSSSQLRPTPENSYTAPRRMEDAINSSHQSFKRKRNASGPEPPAHIYVRTGDSDFNVFSNGFLLYPELCFALTTQMPLRDLVNLYAISKDFHTIIDKQFTTVCVTQALRKAPESAKIFRFRFYSQFCRRDPVARIPHPDPFKAGLSIPRMIPSFRWVGFILHREKVVHELMAVFAERACPLPAYCSVALKKIWLIMDIPENARRVGLMHNTRIITDLDLFFMICVVVKLDMIAHDPLAAEKRDGLRKLLFAQEKGLDMMNKVLKREEWRKQSDYIVAYIRTFTHLEQRMDDENLRQLGIDNLFGVPSDEVGIGKFEYWGKKGIKDPITGQRRQYLLRPDQLIQREAIRRGLDFTDHYLQCALYGYIDPNTFESLPPRHMPRRIPEWNDEDYDILDSVGAWKTPTVEEGGDPLLDLGDTDRGSPYVVQEQPMSNQEKAMRDEYEAFRERMYALSFAEQDAQEAARKAAKKAAKKEKKRLAKEQAAKEGEVVAESSTRGDVKGKGKAREDADTKDKGKGKAREDVDIKGKGKAREDADTKGKGKYNARVEDAAEDDDDAFLRAMARGL